jgi:putative oxidoreductase
MTAIGLAILRLTLAVVFVIHGSHALFGYFRAPGIGPGGLANTASHFSSVGLEPGVLMAVLAGVIQLVGGLLLVVGFLTRSASSALIAYLAILIWKEHARWGFFVNWVNDPTRGHGYEYALVLIGALAVLAFAGAGELSIDGRRAQSAASMALGRARLRNR